MEALTTTNEETRVEYRHVKIMGLLELIRIHHLICWMIGLGFHHWVHHEKYQLASEQREILITDNG